MCKVIILHVVLLLHLTQTGTAQKSNHPFLLITPSAINTIKKQVNDSTWKLQQWQILKQTADKYLTEKIEIPARGGNWEHNYISPKTYNGLVRGKQIGDWKWEHVDKQTGEVFLGDTGSLKTDYDGVMISLIHDTWAVGVLQLGLAYQLSGNMQYEQKAKEILLAYCNIYPKLRERNKYDLKRIVNSGKGKVHVQDLNESIWLIDILQGADLIWPALKKAEQAKIVDCIIKPAVQVIIDRPTDLTNIQCWKNTAIGLAGFFLNDAKLIAYAMNDTTGGFFKQLEKGVTKEGFYADLSPNYHFYSLHALVQLAQAAVNYGYPIDLTILKSLFTTPLEMANRTFQIPAFNDSGSCNLLSETFLYEWAYKVFGEPSYAFLLSNSNRKAYKNLGVIFKGWGLLFGEINLPKPTYKRTIDKIKNFEHTGIVKIENGNINNELSCFLKYSNQLDKRAHYHDAQLEYALIKGGAYMALIPGNVNYASPLANGWYRSSIAHNTLVIDEKQQNASSAKCLAAGKLNGINYTISQTDNAYDSVKFTRTLLVVGDSLVIICDNLVSHKSKPVTMDIAYHQTGNFINPLPASNFSFNKKLRGYSYLKDCFIEENVAKSEVLFNTKRSEIKVGAIADKPFTTIKCLAPSFQDAETACIIYRNTGTAYSLVQYIFTGKMSTAIKIEKIITDDQSVSFNVFISADKLFKVNIHNYNNNTANGESISISNIP